MTRQRKAILKAKGRWIAKHLLFPALAAAAKPEPGWQLPKLTAEQLAEWEEKKERIAPQIAEPNTKWDQWGASVLKLALANTKLVDAAWLAALADSGGVLPRCQDLPAEAVVTYEEMAKRNYGVAVLVISYPWVRAAFEPTAPPPRTLIPSLSLHVAAGRRPPRQERPAAAQARLCAQGGGQGGGAVRLQVWRLLGLLRVRRRAVELPGPMPTTG